MVNVLQSAEGEHNALSPTIMMYWKVKEGGHVVVEYLNKSEIKTERKPGWVPPPPFMFRLSPLNRDRL